jgi:hypothetical protein
MILGDLPVGTIVQFKDFLTQIESQDGHAVHGRTQSGIQFGVRKTHEVVQGLYWTVNARALHVSPSQLTQFMHQCPRQWALDKIGGIHRQGNKFSDRGGKVHKVLEDWQRFAKPPDLTDPIGQIAYPALALTPAPGTATPERCVNWEIGGIEIEFLKDLEQVSERGVEIWDYKTTSNIAYAHTATELLETDPQAITYAAHAFVEFKAPAVRENWLYLTANKPHKCLPVVVDPDRADCLRRFELILDAGRTMIAHRVAQTDPDTFPQNPSHCSAFGGCPYKGVHCHPDEVRSLIDQMNQSIFSQMAAVGQPPPPAAAPVQPPAIAWPPAAAAPVTQPAPPTASAAPPLWMQSAVPVTPAVTQPAPAADPSFAGQGLTQAPASVPGWLSPAQPPPAATVTPDVVVPPPAAVPGKAKKARRTDATPTTLEVQASTETDGPFWEILEALAMNPSLVAMPAVYLVTRALSLIENGRKAIGQ